MKLTELQLRNIIRESLENTLLEAVKSQKLRDAIRQHGGLSKIGLNDTFTDLYNMTDDEFDDYMVYDIDDYARSAGAGKRIPGNMYSKPLSFNDGTFMIKRHPNIPIDGGSDSELEKLSGLRGQRIRSKSKANDGRYNYQYQNPYLNKLINGENYNNGDNPVRGEGNYFSPIYSPMVGGPELDPEAIRCRHNMYTDDEESIVSKARRSSRINEAKLREIIREAIDEISIDTIDNAYQKALSDTNVLPYGSPERVRRDIQVKNFKQERNRRLGFDPDEMSAEIRQHGAFDPSKEGTYKRWSRFMQNKKLRQTGGRVFDETTGRWTNKV